MSGIKRGGGKAAHFQKKLEKEETIQARDYLNNRKMELDKEIKEMEDKLTSGTAAAAAELRAAGAAKSNTALSSRSFFSKLKAKLMDQNLNTKDMLHLIAPVGKDDSPAPTAVSLTEMVNVLQLELLVPITQQDQLLLLQHYSDDTSEGGAKTGMLSVNAFIEDAYLFCGGKDEQEALNIAQAQARELELLNAGTANPGAVEAEGEHVDVQIRETGMIGGPKVVSEVRYDDAEKFSLEKNFAQAHYGELFERSGDNTRSLDGLHAALVAEKEALGIEPAPAVPNPAAVSRGPPASAPAPGASVAGNESVTASESNPIIKLSDKESEALAAVEMDQIATDIGKQSVGGGATTAAPGMYKDKRKPEKPISAADAAGKMATPAGAAGGGEQASPSRSSAPTSSPSAKTVPDTSGMSNKEIALAKENERLRGELQSFDSNFWEQLEDMKYRYHGLQSAVGSDDLQAAHSKLVSHAGPAFTTKVGSATIGNNNNRMPLDQLQWNKRDATAAAASATLDSNLLHRPRYSTGNGIDEELDMAAPVLRHSTGVFPAGTLFQATEDKYGLGPNAGAAQDVAISGNMPVSGKGSVASMCERRLLFELGNHPHPDIAANNLVSRLVEIARKQGNAGRYIRVSHICDTLAGLGLRMKEDEVRIFAAGFGSDGAGGVDVDELCESIQAILFNFIGEHEESMRGKNKYATALEEEEAIARQLKDYLEYHAGNILHYDKKGILGSGVSIEDTIKEPFALADTAEAGVLSYNRFAKVLRELGVTLDTEDDKIIKSYFDASKVRGEEDSAIGENSDPNSRIGRPSATRRGNTTRMGVSFEDQAQAASLRGAAQADPANFGKWLAETHPGSGMDEVLTGEVFITYDAFCKELASAIDRVLSKKRAGENTLTSMRQGTAEADAAVANQWVIREFDLVESLICQLELMRPSARRRALISLQYALLGDDTTGSGQVDGFGLVSALLGAGFQLQRLNRVHLLKCVEEMGGRVEYDDLFQILLRSCSDWTKEERDLVHRILKAMGVTIQERRAWLGRMKAALRVTALEYEQKMKQEAAKKVGGKSKGSRGSTQGGEGDDVEGDVDADLGIPPSAFLHILRDHGVVLNVEQEATLLDCLDTERLASEGSANSVSNSSHSRHIRASAASTANKGKTATWEMPLVFFKSFISFCARHAGDWQDAIPDVTHSIHEAIKSISDPMKGLLELSTLFQAFDESKSGFVGNRAFQIVCHRARMFANLSEKEIVALADTLLAEGGGKIKYTVFIYQLRNFCSKLVAESNKAMLDIGGQLITNATDSNNSLLAIRAWLAKHTDTDSRDAKIGIKHFTALLREFSVLYRPDDVRNLFIEIGSWADKNEDAHRQALADGTDTSLTPSDMKTKQASHLQQLNTCDLMGYLFNLRGAWPSLHERLCHRMAKSMQSIGVSVFIQGANPPAGTANGSSGAATGESRGGAGSSDMGFPKGPKGIETATARRIIARLRAFTGVPASDVTNKTNGSLEDEEEEKMIDLDVFGAICRATGLHLNDEELLLLADSTDRHPLANRINCDVLLDSIASVTESNTEAEEKRKATSDMSTSDKAAKFALKHLGDTLSNAGTRLKRKRREWQKDVTTVMKGFDSQKVGFITTEDFQMALTLLNAKIDLAILRDIPRVPEGPGMVAYQDILEGVFGRSSVMEDEEDGKGKSDAKKPTNTKGLSVAAQRKATLAAMEEEERAKEKQKEASSTAVQALIKVIRKSMKKSAQEQARKRGGGKASAIGLDLSNDLKTRLNKAFKQFDSEDAGVCSPRDFCLAVSVLLDRDEVLLTENQWGEVISFFAPPGKSSKGGKDPDIVSSLPLVDYVRFIKLVMMEEDPAAVSPNKK